MNLKTLINHTIQLGRPSVKLAFKYEQKTIKIYTHTNTCQHFVSKTQYALLSLWEF